MLLSSDYRTYRRMIGYVRCLSVQVSEVPSDPTRSAAEDNRIRIERRKLEQISLGASDAKVRQLSERLVLKNSAQI
jgi:hypothetical protein